MKMLTVSETWKTTYPYAAVGILALQGAANPERHPALEARKAALEERLRARYADLDRAALKALPQIAAYAAYYKQFKKTYHLLLQLESVVFDGKPIPRVAALVEAMFMAELDDLLLTAGHDLALVELPLRLDVAEGHERFVNIAGQENVLKPGDMFIADAQGVLSSIVYGSDQRTMIAPNTTQALFTTYAPAGIGAEAVRQHLQHIKENVALVSPDAKVIALEVYTGVGSGK
jgi:DNA/RNA-binding domain of Phe-tRNA-synthetase-like protein